MCDIFSWDLIKVLWELSSRFLKCVEKCELKASEQPTSAKLFNCDYSHLNKLGVSQSGANEDYAVVQVGQTLGNRSLTLNK